MPWSYTARHETLTGAFLAFVVCAAVAVHAADPAVVIVWHAQELKERGAKAKAASDPALHRGVERLLDSATLIYRDGPSEAEAHTDRADFITVREGRGVIVIGGTVSIVKISPRP